MAANLVAFGARAVLVFGVAVGAYAQARGEATDIRALLAEGKAALGQNRLREAAVAFQKAVDLNPSSAKAHEGLGMALSRQIMAGNVRPSNDMDAVQRAESHLKQASDLSPSSPAPLLQLSELNAALAARAADADERSDRYKSAREMLKHVVDLQPGNAALYFQLASIERDEFGPPIQDAKARLSQKPGPLPDANLRRALQNQYGSLIEDAIANASRASELNGTSAAPLLLLSKMLRERALIRDTPEQYAADMHSAEQWRLQFLAVGGHAGDAERVDR